MPTPLKKFRRSDDIYLMNSAANNPFKVIAVFAAIFLYAQFSFANEICIYIDEGNKLHQVHGKSEVPKEYVAQTRCFQEKESKKKKPEEYHNNLAAPTEVALKGTIRKENMSSSVGRIDLRWPRSVELLFGRSPQQAMAEAARVVSRSLKSGGFPLHVQTLNLDWEVVFMETDLPENQIPSYLQHSCHPAWMTPPSNLYFVSKRIASGCSNSKQKTSSSVANETLAQVIIHEMGHAVEFALLRDKTGIFGADRERAEGFASWFEYYAAGYSSIVDKKNVLTQFKLAAPFATEVFNGSGEDYALSALQFVAIQERFGIRGIFKVYDAMIAGKIQFKDAVKKVFGWDAQELRKEAKKIAI